MRMIVEAQNTNPLSNSGFAIPNGSNISEGLPGFSLNQTEPTQGNQSGTYWSGEGQQHFHQDPVAEPVASHGFPQNGFSDSLSSVQESQEAKAAQYNDQSSFSGTSRSHWNELAPHMASVAMSREPSQDSIGAQSQMTTNSYDQSRSTRMYPNMSQMSYHMSSASSDATGRSNSPDSAALYTPTQQMDMQMLNFPYPGEDFAESHPMFHRGSTASSAATLPIVSMNAGLGYMYATDGTEPFIPTGSTSTTSQGPVGSESMMYHASTIMESPTLWDNGTEFLDSQRSSPILFEDSWSLPTTQLAISATNSPFEPSHSVEGISPRYVQDTHDLIDFSPHTTSRDRVMRKPIGPRPSKVASDLAARRQRLPKTSETSDESFKLSRSNADFDNSARDHHLYHNVTPHADGLYHCPWEKDTTANCQHKPEKLKCNYDKFVDSHLKPYKCKMVPCKDLQFSSTACLLRHEREAHAMHGHGDKPFACPYEGCERGLPGNGFPRHWNLRDHMKRVHNDPGQAQSKSNASASPPPSGSSKSKKRKAGDGSETSSLDTAPKRIATPPVAKPEPQEPSLIVRYQEKHQMLQDLVNQLYDPTKADNMALLRNAWDCLKVMGQTSHRINAVPATEESLKTQSG
ncbi:hypothetical protein QTJ16_000706 [Diplocarpon rosae]|uniref:C2H2-type domain-containing protein n=1 Tax=Diplocarpon rosae TaxID=946125 RepID=A0AAD9T5E9_9HELO|nr:hypothetical protein QTJ16_000706 [Diplocarpon rosae]